MRSILGIVGSPREGGNTHQLVERVLAAARAEGAETRLFACAGKTIQPCAACDACIDGRTDLCVIDDDMQPLYPLLRWADAIVFGSPVYMGTITAQLKAIFDRARPLWRQPGGLLHKAAAAVVVGEGRWGRQEHAFQTIYWAALNHGMVIPGPDCEVCGVADAPGDIQRDAQALAAADDLGRRLARMTLRLG